jgi:hypothetical protein
MAYNAYKKFFEMSQGSSVHKTYEQFATSQFYNAFNKFTNYMLTIKAVNPERFIEYVIKNDKKIDHWCKSAIYQEYLVQYIRSESAKDGLERSVMQMQNLETELGIPFDRFFKDVTTNRMVQLITIGSISPWVIYSCDSGIDHLQSMSDEQLTMIDSFADADHWSRRFMELPGDYAWVKHLLKEGGL